VKNDIFQNCQQWPWVAFRGNPSLFHVGIPDDTGFFKKNNHTMKYHTTDVGSPPFLRSMLLSAFCVWRHSKNNNFCWWCPALPITTLKLGVAGVSKVPMCTYVVSCGCFFWRASTQSYIATYIYISIFIYSYIYNCTYVFLVYIYIYALYAHDMYIYVCSLNMAWFAMPTEWPESSRNMQPLGCLFIWVLLLLYRLVLYLSSKALYPAFFL